MFYRTLNGSKPGGPGLTGRTDMSEVEKQSHECYEKALADETHTALLVFEQG